MTTHKLGNHAGRMTLFGELLLVIYDAGDCDTICATEPDMDNLKRALFDVRECDDRIKYGDKFDFNGQIIDIDAM